MLFRGLELMPTVPDSPAIMQADEQASVVTRMPEQVRQIFDDVLVVLST